MVGEFPILDMYYTFGLLADSVYPVFQRYLIGNILDVGRNVSFEGEVKPDGRDVILISLLFIQFSTKIIPLKAFLLPVA